jgi:hypothetical protein
MVAGIVTTVRCCHGEREGLLGEGFECWERRERSTEYPRVAWVVEGRGGFVEVSKTAFRWGLFVYDANAKLT